MTMKRMLLLLAALLAAGALWAQIADKRALAEPTEVADPNVSAPPAHQVEVVNFPDPQNGPPRVLWTTILASQWTLGGSQHGEKASVV